MHFSSMLNFHFKFYMKKCARKDKFFPFSQPTNYLTKAKAYIKELQAQPLYERHCRGIATSSNIEKGKYFKTRYSKRRFAN